MNNRSELSTEQRKETMKELEYYYGKMYELGSKLGIDNIMEKAKIKEVIMGYRINDRVFPNSTGEVKGADAFNEETREYREYKTTELTLENKERFLKSIVDGTATFSGSIVYNNAGGTGDDLGKRSRGIVNSYKSFGHYHGVFHRGKLVSITRVDTDYVTGEDGLMKRVIKEESGTKYSSTNGNGVGVHYENGGVREGEVVYINDIRK
jgi:hypothetical protein